MMDWLLSSNDLIVIFVIAGVVMFVANLVAEFSHRAFFRRHEHLIEPHGRLLDIVHTSLLAFIAFMLAISVSGVQANFGKADDEVSREGTHIGALDRDLGQLDLPWATAIRNQLHRYVEIVTTEEWASLAHSPPSLTTNAQHELNAIRLSLRSPEIDNSNRQALVSQFNRLEEDRAGRYENSTRSIPRIFWVLIGCFMIGAMVMNGRFYPTALSRALVAMHFAGIGMCIALILIIDAPFRGQTSIGPAPIINAIRSN